MTGSRIACRCGVFAVLAALTGCWTTPPRPAETPTGPTAEQRRQMVAVIRNTAEDLDGEVSVRPLRDPWIEDLRNQAAVHEAGGDYASAALALNQALEVNRVDPSLLQERAEIAILLQDDAMAEELAMRAYRYGSQLGPLCRRHWATVWVLRLVENDQPGLDAAQDQIHACHVTGPRRF